MRIAHLILAHKAPAQLARLVQALAHPQADLYIHLDQKTDYQPFAHLAALPNVQFTQVRLDVKWGGYSLTQASLEGMREILHTGRPYDFINLLSGEDYPIKPVAAIHAFLARHLGHSFLEYEAQGSAWWQANASHFDRYHFTELSFRGRYALQRVLNALLPRRRPPLPVLYGGNMGGWYTLSRECAAYVLGFLDARPRLQRFFRYTWGSDEFVVQSIVLNSPLAPTVINNNLRYIDWSGGGHSPKTFTPADLPALQASARLYARKFDAQQGAAVLEALDQSFQESR
ncbi:core-2/I-branching beta-1,6-N-acetylglucosaminyltransferase family protein [Hymenobacter daeguensis]